MYDLHYAYRRGSPSCRVMGNSKAGQSGWAVLHPSMSRRELIYQNKLVSQEVKVIGRNVRECRETGDDDGCVEKCSDQICPGRDKRTVEQRNYISYTKCRIRRKTVKSRGVHGSKERHGIAIKWMGADRRCGYHILTKSEIQSGSLYASLPRGRQGREEG